MVGPLLFLQRRTHTDTPHINFPLCLEELHFCEKINTRCAKTNKAAEGQSGEGEGVVGVEARGSTPEDSL